MAIDDVLLRYEHRLSEAQAGLVHARTQSLVAALVLGFAVVLLITLGVLAIRHQMSLWWPAAALLIGLGAGSMFRRFRQTAMVMWRIRSRCERAIQRMRGQWPGVGVAGRAFDDPHHGYAHDLGVFGDGSLFELLCTTRSGIGEHGLATYLLDPPSLAETLARQQAVSELRSQTALREQLALLGPFEFSRSNWSTFQDWIDAPPVRFPSALRVALLASSSALAVILLARIFSLIPWIPVLTWSAPLIAFQFILWLTLRTRVRPMIESVRLLSAEIQLLHQGIRLVEESRFESPKLRELSKHVQGAARPLRQLERLLNALQERNKEWFYFPSLLLMLGTQLSMAIEHWRLSNGSTLRSWLDAFAEFEALNALACYAYENPQNTFPEFLEQTAALHGKALGHPLLPLENCVPNDVDLNADSPFYVVSGSNMSGKSTLLRAIGLNVVLARAGAPVRAERLRLSPVTVCASISVVDSLQAGKSKFLAEIDRLRQAIEFAKQPSPVLFLIDEILSGTNSRDRRIVAEAVVRTLIERGAIGALSTHDLALTEIATELGGSNVHMGSKNDGSPLEFDYRLKPGVTEESNALAIAQMAGVPV